MDITNRGSKSTFKNSIREEVTDITLASRVVRFERGIDNAPFVREFHFCGQRAWGRPFIEPEELRTLDLKYILGIIKVIDSRLRVRSL